MNEAGGEPRDSSPLELKKLSDWELAIILQIEARLGEAQQSAVEWRSAVKRGGASNKSYLAPIQVRHPRVLLLDGGRGTGKTSILLTLAQRWAPETLAGVPRHDSDREEYAKRIGRVEEDLNIVAGTFNPKIPDHVNVIGRILDFDPLPPEMPLIAGIMQAWKPLAKRFDELSARDYDCDDEGGTLMDAWHRLFQVAAVGWAATPQSKGLLEQVLDSQAQVEDWHHLDSQWRDFVDEVINRGKCLPESEDKFSNELEPIFVIMIDDCDLQVGRIRELLPALRMLYHPNVFFLVAAHRGHMLDMLMLSFYGQQNDLARHQNTSPGHANDMVSTDKWAGILAQSSAEKVFSKRNQWKLEWLSIFDFLAFPGQVADLPADPNDGTLDRDPPSRPSFFSYLQRLEYSTQSSTVADQDDDSLYKSAARLIGNFARESREFLLPGIMTYRGAEQLYQYTTNFHDDTHRATEVLARLLSGNVGEHQAIVRRNFSGEGKIRFTIEVQFTGQLAALYRPGPREFGGTYDVVLSARPDFVFVDSPGSSLIVMSETPEGGFNFTAALIAQELYEEKFPLRITGLRWDTYLSLCWTEWKLSPPLAFAWTLYEHPSPVELFKQTKEWAQFIDSEVVDPQGEQRSPHKLERYAYAWVYYQLKWYNGLTGDRVPSPLKIGYLDPPPWSEILDFSDYPPSVRERWLNEVLPLLARPELGFPPSVQEEFLKAWMAGGGVGKNELRILRRRLVTGAYVAAAYQRGDSKAAFLLPTDEEIDAMISKIDRRYTDAHSDALKKVDPNFQWEWIEKSESEDL